MTDGNGWLHVVNLAVEFRGQGEAFGSLSLSTSHFPTVFVVWQGTIILVGVVVLFVCGRAASVGGSCQNKSTWIPE